MKTLLLSTLIAVLPGGDRERGLLLYQQGKFEEAAAAFRLAIASEGDSAELQYNLALASWRAGDLATAETAVEKYAALASDARVDLHAGLLGGVRYEEAKRLEDGADDALARQEDPLPRLEQALAKAAQARDHFVRGASAVSSPEVLRNTERAIKYIAELEKKIEELEQQRQEQQDQQNDEQQQDDENRDERQDEKPAENEQQKGEGEQNEQQKSEPKPAEPEQQQGAQEPAEPDPGERQKSGDQESGGQQPQPEPQPRSDAPGEAAEGRELSPEQTQRLLEQLQDLEGKLKALRSQLRTRRRPVERDW